MLDHLIPKKLHYCWYGGKPLPDLALRCIESWKTFLPEYELKRWDERNTDLNSNGYIKQAYESGKYAFVSDYVRLKVLAEEGGIYMDTDVEVLKNLDPYLHHKAFCGFQNPSLISVGILGAVPGHFFIHSLLDLYETINFLDKQGKQDMTPNTVRITDFAVKEGLQLNNKKQEFAGLTVYPTEYFCPKNYDEYYFTITENTTTLHHYAGSWYDKKTKWFMRFRVHFIKRFMPWIDRPLNTLYHLITK